MLLGSKGAASGTNEIADKEIREEKSNNIPIYIVNIQLFLIHETYHIIKEEF